MEDYPDYPQAEQAAGQLISAKQRRPDITLRQNIDQKIVEAEKRVEELKAIRARLDETHLLDSRIDDLQQAMRW